MIGGGIAGLAAAVRLRERAPAGTRITVYEQSAALGGKLRTGRLAGAASELGAEAFLAGDPAGGDSAAVALAHRLGLGPGLRHPAVVPAAIAIDGHLAPVPRGTLVGVPGDLAAVAPVAHPDAWRDRDEGRPLLAPGEDVTVGALVRRRLGDEVVDRLVDPMLGGVYAGRADRLSLAATMPTLARAATAQHTLVGAVRAAQARARRTPGAPIFATLAGGVGRLVAGAAAASGAELRLGLPVRELTRTPTGWRLVLGPVPAPETADVDAVILAVPAGPATRLLAGVGITLDGPDYASVALVSFAVPDAGLPALSGFLVPAADGRLVKAATLLTRKWEHLRRPDGIAVIRASVGRYGEEHVLQRDDPELAAAVHGELRALLGTPLGAPIDTHVQRWGGALPQYTPGHLDRIAAVRAALRTRHPTLALAGAAYDGVGIPACVSSGEAAADTVLAALRTRRTVPAGTGGPDQGCTDQGGTDRESRTPLEGWVP